MPIDTVELGRKLKRMREQLQLDLQDIALATGLPADMLSQFESGEREPFGDHILILADYFKCDYRFFISNERLTAIEQTEQMFRKHGSAFSKEDRWAIQEFLYLCDCEHWLQQDLSRVPAGVFFPHVTGRYYKGHAEQAAQQLRAYLGYQPNEQRLDVFSDYRRLGLHLFRRQLPNSNISGVFIRHPSIGKCVLVNYNEDVFRQRFTASHEVAHALFDGKTDFVVSFVADSKELTEVRANTFASRFLLPPEFLRRIPDSGNWSSNKVLEWAAKLMVNPETLAYALNDARLIDGQQKRDFAKLRITKGEKPDPELPSDLSPQSLSRRHGLLKMGVSHRYATLCFDAYDRRLVSAGRLSEVLLVDRAHLPEIAEVFGRPLRHDG